MRYVFSILTLLATFSKSQADAEKKPLSAFEKMAQDVVGIVVLQYAQFDFVPPLSALGKVEVPEFGSLKEFPQALLKALHSAGTKDQAIALTFIQSHAGVARKCAFDRGLKDLEAATYRVFAPHAKEIEGALVKALDSKALSVRWKAASALLAFQPAHAKANSILASGIEVEDKEFRCMCCQAIGMLHLTNESVMNSLIHALGQNASKVQRSAANAVCQIGPEAKATVPALIRFLESGESARGELDNPYAFDNLGADVNLALVALSGIGPDAAAAVPTIITLFPKASREDQKEMLSCLTRIGPGVKESLTTIRQAMKSHDADFRITAACTLLRITPDNEEACTIVKNALNSREKKVRKQTNILVIREETVRKQTLDVCGEIGPRSKAVLAAVTVLLADDDEDIRIAASLALAKAGSDASMAIPALEKLLTKEDDHMKHTFLSHQAAAVALGQIGKAAAPALIRATAANSGGREYAIAALGSLGKDVPPEAVKRLAKIIGNKKDKRAAFFAVCALGRLGRHAQSAREALEKLDRNDALMVLGVSWALMEVDR